MYRHADVQTIKDYCGFFIIFYSIVLFIIVLSRDSLQPFSHYEQSGQRIKESSHYFTAVKISSVQSVCDDSNTVYYVQIIILYCRRVNDLALLMEQPFIMVHTCFIFYDNNSKYFGHLPFCYFLLGLIKVTILTK